MSELAFNANGESFEVPANVTGWRVRRMKPRGAPELVYGKDGRPLMIPIESAMEDLRDSVSQLGRYRLDPINEDGRTVEGVPAACIQVVKPASAEAAPLATHAEHDDPVREAMRLNTELARAVIDRFPEMMTAAAELLRAADGAGLPARQRRVVEDGDIVDDDGDDVAIPNGFDINTIVAQLVPVFMAALANGKLKLPGLGAMLDWRKAVPDATEDREPPKHAKTAVKPGRSSGRATESNTVSSELPPIEPATMAHFVAIQGQLTSEESALAREVAQQLEPAELRQWFDELSELSIPDAVAKIRANIVHGGKTGGAS